MKAQKERVLIKVSEFASGYPKADGSKGVSASYVYKVHNKAKEDGKNLKKLGWAIVSIAGYNLVEIFNPNWKEDQQQDKK